MATLREALERSASGVALNEDALVYDAYKIIDARRLADGRVKVTWYEFEGEYRTETYESPEEAIAYLFGPRDTLGTNDWEAFEDDLTGQ